MVFIFLGDKPVVQAAEIFAREGGDVKAIA
jgi:hypothetical protein